VRRSDAPCHGLPALVYDTACAGSRAYMALARELIRRLPQERKAA
jgi:chromosome partitioning protein